MNRKKNVNRNCMKYWKIRKKAEIKEKKNVSKEVKKQSKREKVDVNRE